MRTWIYERGRWVEARYPFREEFDDLGGELERLGFERQEAPGFRQPARIVRVGTGVRGARRHRDGRGSRGPVDVEFLVSVNTPTRRYPVFVVDLPSLVQLMGELRPLLASEPEKTDFEDH